MQSVVDEYIKLPLISLHIYCCEHHKNKTDVAYSSYEFVVSYRDVFFCFSIYSARLQAVTTVCTARCHAV